MQLVAVQTHFPHKLLRNFENTHGRNPCSHMILHWKYCDRFNQMLSRIKDMLSYSWLLYCQNEAWRGIAASTSHFPFTVLLTDWLLRNYSIIYEHLLLHIFRASDFKYSILALFYIRILSPCKNMNIHFQIFYLPVYLFVGANNCLHQLLIDTQIGICTFVTPLR